MPKVYVVQEPIRFVDGVPTPTVDLSPASAYGDIEVVLPHGNVPLSPNPLVQSLRRGLKDFTNQDYILPTGDPAATTIACCVAATFNRGQFKLLKWNKQTQSYIALDINVNGQEYVA